MTGAARALKAGYFTYFAAIGVFQPYWPIALAAQGFLPQRIGVLMAAVNAMRIIAPLAQERFGRWVGNRVLGVALTALMAALVVPGLAVSHQFVSELLGMMFFSLCLNGLMPLYDAIAVDLLQGDGHRYGRVRLWGSLGFIVGSAVVGALLARSGTVVVAVMLGGFLLATALACWGLPASATPSAPVRLDFAAQGWPRSSGRWLLVVCFLQLASFGGYYSFYSLYLQRFGFTEQSIGLYWSLGVIAEIAVFYAGGWLVRSWSLTALLQVALAGTVVRWVLIAGWPDSAWVLGCAQLLHLFGFGLFHTVCVLLAPRLLAVDSARALAYVSSIGWGAGGVAGSLLAGRVWAVWGPQAVFRVSTGLALTALLVAGIFLRRPQRA